MMRKNEINIQINDGENVNIIRVSDGENVNLSSNGEGYQSYTPPVEKPKVSGAYSWPVIVLAFIFFWPLGIYLLVKRNSVDKKSALTTGKLVVGFGYASIAFSILGMFAAPTDGVDSSDISMIIFFLITGLVLLFIGKRMKKAAERCKKYIAIIANQHITSIDQIAQAASVGYETAKKDLEKMIHQGYFSGAYINEGAREIVLPGSHVSRDHMANNVIRPAQTKVVTCKNCGATNTVVSGSAAECEFCGSPIN